MRHLTDSALEPALWWTGEWSLRWAALIALLAVALAVCRPRRAATRHLLCLAVLLAGLALPAVPRWGPGWRTAAPPPAEAPAPAAAAPEALPPLPRRCPGPTAPRRPTRRRPAPSPRRAPNRGARVAWRC